MGNTWWYSGQNRWWGVKSPDGRIHPTWLKLTKKEAVAAYMETCDQAFRLGLALGRPIPETTWKQEQERGATAVRVEIVPHTANNALHVQPGREAGGL